MVRRSTYDYVLVGGGLQNGLMALAILNHNPDARVALIERLRILGGNHTWCFLRDEVIGSARRFVEPLVVHRWPGFRVAFPGYQRTFDTPLAAITCRQLDEVVSHTLLASSNSKLYMGCEAHAITAHEVVLGNGYRLCGEVVIDARGIRARFPATGAGFQKFFGQECVLATPHRVDRPVLMDAAVDQTDDGYRYFFTLPLAPDRLLIAEICFSDTPDLARERLRDSIATYAAMRGYRIAAITREELGILPIPWQGLAPVAPPEGPLIAGCAGGWFHPGTGYSFLVAARLADYVARTPALDLFGAGLRQLASEHQRQARYCHRLNKTLFGQTQPEQRRNALERFYRLPEDTIRRFHALSLTTRDRARLALGWPAVSIALRRVWSRPRITTDSAGRGTS